MVPTHIELPAGKIARITDVSDLAELLFPRNRNQQHAFLVVWFTLKWQPDSLVPKLATAARQYRISRRTLERVRAKLRRLGLIDRVSRFNARHGHREGWVLSTRFERGLRQLADKVKTFKERANSSQEKDLLLVELADAHREVIGRPAQSRTDYIHNEYRGDSG